mgnify:CR=1 FL=1
MDGMAPLHEVCEMLDISHEELKEYDVNMFLLEVERIEAQLKEVEGNITSRTRNRRKPASLTRISRVNTRSWNRTWLPWMTRLHPFVRR